jgi:hypothetical protein
LISFCREHGYLGGSTFTNMHGLLQHQVFDMWGPGGSAAYPAVMEGYINFGWPGLAGMCCLTYAVIILAERLFAHLPRTPLTYSVMMFYCLLATKVSQLSLSATFVSMTYTVAIGSLVAMDQIARWGRGRKGIRLPRRMQSPERFGSQSA